MPGKIIRGHRMNKNKCIDVCMKYMDCLDRMYIEEDEVVGPCPYFEPK